MLKKDKKRYLLRVIIPSFPAFNIYSHVARITTALGPVCVASAVNEMPQWDAEVIDENNLRKYGPKSPEGGADHEFLQHERPADVVGFYGGLSSTIPRLYALSKFYKSQGVVTIAGGQHFCDETIPEAFSFGIDYIVFHEAEEAIKELLRVLQNNTDPKTVDGILFRSNDGTIVKTSPRAPICDFEKLPLPDFSLVRYAKIKLYPVERIRGCGMNCEFCTVKGKPRAASPERMLKNISKLVESHGAQYFFIVDDLFGQHREETIRMCRMLEDYQNKINKNLRFGVQIRLDKGRDTELISAMRDAGINGVAIGFESPVEEELDTMSKNLKRDDMIALSREYHKAGFMVHGMFIFGYPLKKGDKKLNSSIRERVAQYRKFIKKAKLDTIQVMLPVPLPGTELRKRLIDDNKIFPLRDVGWEFYDGNFPLFAPDAPTTIEEMHRAIGQIMGGFYQFKRMFYVCLNVFSFLRLIFFPHNIKLGWRLWYRHWRNNLIRFGGWITMKRWMKSFNQETFYRRIHDAKQHLKS